MMVLLNVFLLSIFAHLAFSHCPESDKNLVKWSDHKNTWNDSQPTANGNVTISKSILLDEQPPTLWSITIESGGKLIWDPTTYVHLKIHWIRVDGELHIGSEDCPFTERTRVTFLGNVNENDLGPGGDKALFVMSGGVLEIHGKPKLSWTKLTKTANKMTKESGLHTEQKNLASGKVSGKGLVVYDIDPTSGKIHDEVYVNFNRNKKNLPSSVLEFVSFLDNIPTGHIVGLAVKRELARKGDIDDVLKAIEILAGQDEGTNPLRSTDGAAYVLFTKKGSPETTTEMYAPWDDSEERTIASISVTSGDLYVTLRSVYNNKKSQMSFVDVVVADDLTYRPILHLLESASSWQEGDNLILASTDYDWKQAEEVKVIKCEICTSDFQIRLSAPLKFTHYGEIYKNVDMRGEIGLLSRNILFDSEDAEGSETYGGNLKVLKGFKSVHIEHAEFSDLGQQEVLGRYPLHFHMCDDVDLDNDTRPWLKHNSIHHSNSRCVTVHGTHGLIVEDNVCYLTLGHGYFLEDGGEKRTVLDGNLGLGTQKGTLIKADRSPATFWVTNPISFVRNNVAAGGAGKGYWYAFPEIPIGPSKEKGYMLKHEARHTPISEFDNNVAHSYQQHGLFFDNEFAEDTDALGYNRYRPVEDPIMHLQFQNSTDKPAVFNRFTGYKNSPRNAWLRGGMLKVTRASLSDSGQSILIVKENMAIQFFEESVIIGDSPNVGEVEEINDKPVSIGRSFPNGAKNGMRHKWRTGYAFRNGPIHVKDVYFDNFADNQYYYMGAIGFDTVFRQSPVHTVVNAQFGFSDPSEGNRVQIEGMDPTTQILDDIRTFRDIDYSVTEVDLQGRMMTAITPVPFVLTDKCTIRKNWNFAYCEHTYGAIVVSYMGDDNVATMTRDDNYKKSRIDADADHKAKFLTILGEQEYSYSMFWENEIPEKFNIVGQGVSNSNGVRVGVCLPPNAEFKLFGIYPSKYMMKKWTNVSSVDDVDSPAKYFYDIETGYLAIYMQNDNDFQQDNDRQCPEDLCAKVFVEITAGDRKQTDCLDAAHDKFDLKTDTSVSRRRLSQLLSLLARQSHKYHQRTHVSRQSRRFGRSADNTKELLATARQPPSNWGAGATR